MGFDVVEIEVIRKGVKRLLSSDAEPSETKARSQPQILQRPPKARKGPKIVPRIVLKAFLRPFYGPLKGLIRPF